MVDLRACLLLTVSLFPVATLAHPHVFVDTRLRLQVGADGTFEGVEISWTYDDFYSLLLLSDMGLMTDADGRLGESDLAQLDGFDLQWVDGFAGDTFATRDGLPVSLGPPEGRGVSVKNGLITSVHYRAASGAMDGVVIKAFDPTFYTAYSLVGPVEVDAACSVTVEAPDLDAAYTKVEELLYATPSGDAEADFPEVGEAFADTVRVSCPS